MGSSPRGHGACEEGTSLSPRRRMRPGGKSRMNLLTHARGRLRAVGVTALAAVGLLAIAITDAPGREPGPTMLAPLAARVAARDHAPASRPISGPALLPSRSRSAMAPRSPPHR